jgi:hypothetical protein
MGLAAYLWNDVQEIVEEIKRTWRVWTYKPRKIHNCAEAGCFHSSQSTGLVSYDAGKTWVKPGPTWPERKEEK